MEPVDLGKLELNLQIFEKTLLEDAAGKSLVFLLDKGRERNFASPFEKELARRLRLGVKRLLSGKLESGTATIKGLGFGLTPSGDDFLAGFLLGMHALQTAAGVGFSKERRAVYQAARSNNPFSDALLRCAAEGRYFQRAKSLIQALFEGASADVVRHAHRLLAVGASSGADLAVGLFFALKTCCDLRWRSHTWNKKACHRLHGFMYEGKSPNVGRECSVKSVESVASFLNCA